MEANKNTCGYCGKELTNEECGTLTLKDKSSEIIKEVKICGYCLRRVELKINLSRHSKEDLKELNDFLSRNRK